VPDTNPTNLNDDKLTAEANSKPCARKYPSRMNYLTVYITEKLKVDKHVKPGGLHVFPDDGNNACSMRSRKAWMLVCPSSALCRRSRGRRRRGRDRPRIWRGRRRRRGNFRARHQIEVRPVRPALAPHRVGVGVVCDLPGCCSANVCLRILLSASQKHASCCRCRAGVVGCILIVLEHEPTHS
jgi:hypothetical protein